MIELLIVGGACFIIGLYVGIAIQKNRWLNSPIWKSIELSLKEPHPTQARGLDTHG